MDSDAVLQAMEINSASTTCRVSGEFVILQSSVVRHVQDLAKATTADESGLTSTKYNKTFESP